MINEQADENERISASQNETLLVKAIKASLEPQGHVIHWYDVLAIMIVGYWLGNAINAFWWSL